MTALRAAAALAALVALVAPAAADDELDFDWADATVESEKDVEFRTLMRRARDLIQRASEAMPREGPDLAIRAAETLARASALRPRDPTPHFMAAETIYGWDLEIKNAEKWLARGVHHYSEFIRLAPRDPRLSRALFNRSIMLTKQAGTKDLEAKFKAALADYERQLAMLDQVSPDGDTRRDLGRILSNAAELYMGVGDLDTAIEMYLEALHFHDYNLYKYGLAIALDRDGQRGKAHDILREVLANPDERERLSINRQGVFFVPEGDKSYYFALIWEVRGDFRKAADYYRRFIAALPDSPYIERARESLAEVANKRGSPSPARSPLELRERPRFGPLP
jgi:tetratricopeptide (TPR) repeat protein